MSETIDLSGPSSATPIDPADILRTLIVAFLAPMFLTVSGGDIAFARLAAHETLNAYRARDPFDLIAIAQVIACGLSSLGSLSLAMADDLSASMTLRLRGNAVALNRSAEQNRRTLRQTHAVPDHPDTESIPDTTSEAEPPDQARYEAQVIASVAAAQKLTAEAQPRLPDPEPAPDQPQAVSPSTPPAPTTTTPAIAEQQWQAMWASAMTTVAGEFTADLGNLSRTQRKLASRRAAALSSCATQLLSGEAPPLFKPGELTAILQPKKTR